MIKNIFKKMDLTPIRPEKTQFNRKYRRLDKPPYTYVAMTTLAIQVRTRP